MADYYSARKLTFDMTIPKFYEESIILESISSLSNVANQTSDNSVLLSAIEDVNYLNDAIIEAEIILASQILMSDFIPSREPIRVISISLTSLFNIGISAKSMYDTDILAKPLYDTDAIAKPYFGEIEIKQLCMIGVIAKMSVGGKLWNRS